MTVTLIPATAATYLRVFTDYALRQINGHPDTPGLTDCLTYLRPDLLPILRDARWERFVDAVLMRDAGHSDGDRLVESAFADLIGPAELERLADRRRVELERLAWSQPNTPPVDVLPDAPWFSRGRVWHQFCRAVRNATDTPSEDAARAVRIAYQALTAPVGGAQ